MSLIFERIQTQGIAELSYLVGDDSEGVAAVFDPTPDELDKEMPVAVYCDSGYRASIGTSILKQEGFRCVCNVPGSWQAWKKAGFPIEGNAG